MVKQKNKPGAGRPRLYNEPTVHIQVPRSLVELVKAFIREHMKGRGNA